MIRDYSFSEIEKYLRTCSDINDSIFRAVSDLADAAIIFTPIVFGPQFIPLLDMLETKDRLLNLGKRVCDAIVQKIEPDYIQRTAQIRAAYGLICYTAYFDALQEYLPETVAKKLKINSLQKKELIEASQDVVDVPLPPIDIHCEVPYSDHLTSFPELKAHLNKLYDGVTKKFSRLIEKSGIYEDDDTDEYEKLINQLDQIPSRALQVYEAQYINLANKFEDFAQYAQLQNVVGLHNAVESNREAIKLLSKLTANIDVGLRNLNTAVNAIPTNYREIESRDIVEDLKKKYSAIIHEPIIDNKEIAPDSETIMLRFPQIIDAFIPQQYKCMAYHNKDIKLEDIPLWKKLPAYDNLNEFFIKYLFSPDSIDNPLIILGHPGSGKSLLTKVLAAQLMSNSYTVVRIPLREVSADDGIDVLVEDQIKKLTNRPLPQGYGGFASQFIEKPLIIILDGYDELLQAKGDVFSGYLGKVQKFQQDQKSMNRPVRVIVTSRITLIDKARIPLNSTIVRLLEFSPKQQHAWIKIWNHINADYFNTHQIKPFSLPKQEEKKTNSVLELAEQPLLLLMLAMYDSEANELAQKSHIQRTELYDNLLRRFIRRERGRYISDFSSKTDVEQRRIIDQEMNRLGVVAIGMYNRQDVVIHSKELEEDLKNFNAQRSDGSPKPHTLKEAESVLGSFFFIHQSTAQDSDAHSDHAESAYEFLHNTFGEFLAADFILRKTIHEATDLCADLSWKPESEIGKLVNPDSIHANWYYCLMFVPLYSRPVIVEMLREHWVRALDRANRLLNNPKYALSEQEFLDTLKVLVRNQLKMVLNGRSIPKVMRNGVIMGQDVPLLGYLSTHSLNLIILISALINDGYIFDENEYIPRKDAKIKKVETQDAQPWNKVTSLWRTFYSYADLVGLSVILGASRIGKSKILIKCNKDFVSIPYDQPIERLLCVSSTLADDLLTGLAGIHTNNFREITKRTKYGVLELLESISTDIYTDYQIARIIQELQSIDITHFTDRRIYRHYETINEIISSIIPKQLSRKTLRSFIDVIDRGLSKQVLFFSTRKNLLVHFMEIHHKVMYDIDNDRELRNEIGTIIEHLHMDLGGLFFLSSHDMDFSMRRYVERRYREMRFFLEDDITPYTRSYPRRNVVTMNRILHYSNKMDYFYREEWKDFFRNKDALKVFTLTEPGVLTTLLIDYLKFGNDQLLDNQATDLFFQLCIESLVENGLMCYDPLTVEELLVLANRVRNIQFLEQFSSILKRKLEYDDLFIFLLYSDPAFLLKLIEAVPEAFAEFSLEYRQKFPQISRYTLQPQYENQVDYISIFHRLSEIRKDIDIEYYVHAFLRDVNLSHSTLMDYQKLTVTQLEDLMWFANIVSNSEITEKIKNCFPRIYDRRKTRKGLIDYFKT